MKISKNFGVRQHNWILVRFLVCSMDSNTKDWPVSKSDLTHLRPRFRLETWVAQVAGCRRDKNNVNRPGPSLGERQLGELQLKSAQRAFEWGYLLHDQGSVRAGLIPARPQQHCQAKLVAAPRSSSIGRAGNRSIAGMENWEAKNVFSFSMPSTAETSHILYAPRRANSPS